MSVHDAHGGLVPEPTSVRLSHERPAYLPPQILTPLPQPHRRFAYYATRIGPALTTTTALLLARVWNTQGGQSPWSLTGCLALALALGAAGKTSADGINGEPALTVCLLGGSVAVGSFGLMGYTAWPVATGIWLAITAVWYVLANRNWRSDRHSREQRHHDLTVKTIEHSHAERLQAMDTAARVEVSRNAVEISRYAYLKADATARGIEDAVRARTERAIAPGQELNVDALVQAGLKELPGYPGVSPS